ncbi:uncharacterized protein LOC142573142 isoform X3 [Dermacentor variabilis]|uniref:uncharacterized protein LOC142573142 isoform X3 n=1 Tax=Dermacentor variabilis TaxID=34621 RepID=UPI003F5BC48A
MCIWMGGQLRRNIVCDPGYLEATFGSQQVLNSLGVKRRHEPTDSELQLGHSEACLEGDVARAGGNPWVQFGSHSSWKAARPPVTHTHKGACIHCGVPARPAITQDTPSKLGIHPPFRLGVSKCRS